MKAELRGENIVVTGTNRKGRYALCIGAIRHLEERNIPVPEEVYAEERRRKNPEVPDLSEYPFKTKPWPHQLECTEKALAFRKFAVFGEMGTGKSKIALDVAAYLFFEKRAKLAVVACPLSVIPEWKKQWKNHAAAGDLVVASSVKNGKELFKKEFDTPTILLMNYEKARFMEEEMKNAKIDLLVCDESTKIKSHRAKRTKTLANVSRGIEHVLIMTGTPVSKNLVDIFGQYLVMDPFYFGKSFWFFRNRYCWMGGWMAKVIVGYQREDELRSIIDMPSHRVLKKDVLPDLPEFSYTERVVELDPPSKKLYKDASKQFLVELRKGILDIKNAAGRLMKLQEIANGFVIVRDEETAEDVIERVSNFKVNALMECLEEVADDLRVTVWCRFHEDIRAITEEAREKFPDRPIFHLHGKTKNREDVYEKFASSTGGILIAQGDTGGFGIDLSHCHTVFFFSNSFDYVTREQEEARFHRPGQKNAITFCDIVTEGTVDRKIKAVLASKHSLARWVMENKGSLEDLLSMGNVSKRKHEKK